MTGEDAAKLLFGLAAACGVGGTVPTWPTWLWGVGLVFAGVAGIVIAR